MPFDLGHPFGPPNDPGFQLAVLRALLDLFREPSGPVLRDYPLDAPSSGDVSWTCTLPLPPLDEAASPEQRLKQRLLQEAGLIQPWYAEALRSRGRTAAGLTGLPPDRIGELVEYVAAYAAGETPSPPHGLEAPELTALRFAVEDVKAFYIEAASMQPGGDRATGRELHRWLYHETWLGRALYDLRDRLAREAKQRDDPARARVALIPALYRDRPASPPS